MQYTQGNILSNVEKTGNVKYVSLPKTIESVIETVRVRINVIRLFSLRLMFDRSKLESLRDVSVTSIGDTLSHGFPKTDLM